MERKYGQEQRVRASLVASMLIVFEQRHRYAFIEFRNADAATYALNELNGHPFDTKHTFLVNRFTDIEHFADLDETYVDPPREEYRTKVRC
jgi:hypothetical protein